MPAETFAGQPRDGIHRYSQRRRLLFALRCPTSDCSLGWQRSNAVERMWDISPSQGQIMALALRHKSLKHFLSCRHRARKRSVTQPGQVLEHLCVGELTIPTHLPAYLRTYVPTYLRSYLPTYLCTYLRTYLRTYAFPPTWSSLGTSQRW